MNATIRKIEDDQSIRRGPLPFKVGDTVKISLRIKEGEKERIQVYEGLVIGIQGTGGRMRFTVRKISYGVGVEKTFYYQSPMIKDIKTVRSGKVRRGKLFYLRGKMNKKDTRIQESKKNILSINAGASGPAAESSAEPAPEPAAEAPAAESAPQGSEQAGPSEKA